MPFIDTKFRRLSRKIISVSTRLIIPFDRYLQNKKVISSEEFKERGIVFIVGAPRTGSTFLYQILSNYLDVSYLSNLANFFYHSLYTGINLHYKIYGNRPHNNYTSDNGRTRRWIDVSESGKFWYQFYPSAYHIINNESIPEEKLLQLYNTLRVIQEDFKRPLLFKNQHFAQRISSLAGLFPDSFFIYVKRSPLPTAKSIIRHRKRFNDDIDEWYSVKPANYKEIKDTNYKEQVVHQIHGVNAMIEKQLVELSKDRYLRVKYEDLSDKWSEIVDNIYNSLNNLGKVQYRSSVEPPEFKEPKTVTDGQESIELKKIIEKVYA